MQKTMMLIIGIASGGLCFGQKVSPEVMAAAGDHFSTTNGELSWTIGEVMPETFTNNSNKLTQGFHQTNLTITAVENIDESLAVKVFPNPASTAVMVEVPQGKETIMLELFDLNGKLLYSEKLESFSNSVNLETYPSANYLLRLSTTNKVIKSFQISKIN